MIPKGNKDKHEHVFNKPVETKVLLTAGEKSAYDILRGWKCSCGKVLTADIKERTII